MKLCVVLVHYFTPDLLRACVESIMTTTRSIGEALDIVVVDNGSEAADRPLIDALPVSIIRPGPNLGYAAAFNRAVAACPADVYVLMNPDIEVAEGCVETLAGIARDTGGIAGPCFYLDRRRRFLLPPAEDRALTSEFLREAAGSSAAVAPIARVRWRRHARRHWTAAGPIRSYHLSGAMMAISAAALAAVGPFDEAFRLYYEETDWLWRAAAIGVPSTYAPTARATHFYNKSAGSEPRAPQWFSQSEHIFRRKHHGAAATWLLGLLHRMKKSSPVEASVELEQLQAAELGPAVAPSGQLWLELTLSKIGFPATGARGGETADLLAAAKEILPTLGPGAYFLSLVGDDGTELWRRGVKVGG